MVENLCRWNIRRPPDNGSVGYCANKEGKAGKV